ncbi:MAG: hypothetical protein GXP32_05100 [Kiritimatiellaeota bacterium]|nr:hypothetical protein [Kiritimatiellota bacterium]
MNFLKTHRYQIILLAITSLAVFLRFHNLIDSGFKFTDEGYHFYPAIDLYNAFDRGTTRFLTWYHGLEFWICLGCSFLGFTYNGALLWGATCGTAAVPLFYLFCSRLFSKRAALLCALALAFNYYLVFYARTALSTGYAVFFLCWFLVVFDWAMRECGVCRTVDAPPSNRTRFHGFFPIFVAGVFLGMLEHIRIELGFIGVGLVGAMGISLALENGFSGLWSRRTFIFKSWIPLFILLFVAVATYVSFFALLNALDWVDWKNSAVFYKGHLGFAAKSDHPWGPYLLTNIWRLAGTPFILLALLGLIFETVDFKRLALRRRWFLIAFWGLSLFLFKTGLAYPRTYVYTVLFLCAYWGMGVRRISLFFARRRSARVGVALAVFLVSITFYCEVRLIGPLFHKKSRYDEAERFIAERGAGNIHVTHSWPIFELLPFPYRRFVVYDTYSRFPEYEDFCGALRTAYEKQHARYMVLDNNLAYWGGDTTMIQQFAATILPTAVFRNDYGDDWHTCMDAFGKPPAHDMFTNRIMVYDIKEFAKNPGEPIPFFGAKRMDEIFTRRWAEKTALKNKNRIVKPE